MDLGVVRHKIKQNSQTAADPGSNQPGNDTGHGSGNLKHQRSDLAEDIWKNPKMPRASEVDFSSFKKSGYTFERSNLWASSGFDDGQKMLSFSSSEPRSNGGTNGSRSIAFSIPQEELYSRAGGGFNEVMRGPFARLKGPFTPSQWMELEVQALIYKHFVANVPVPCNLLLSLKRSLYSYGSSASYAPNFLGWGPFHLGYPRSNDPEPGRCRRTDGKKWRCSKDAVPDQKYCERHINRGRHRSRKHVEGQTGNALSGSTTTTPTVTKVEPIAPSSASVMSSRSPSSSFAAMQHQYNVLQPSTSNAFTNHLVSRSEVSQGPAFIPSTDLKSKDVPFAIPKPHAPIKESSHSMFGQVTSDALVNPSERISYMNTRNTDSYMGFNEKSTTDENHVLHFTDDWPKDQPNRTTSHWPGELKYDWTQLSMSIPVAPDFSSSSTSPAQDKSTVPALKLTHEIKPINMSLGVNPNLGACWESSMGGPLGEVLTSSGGAGQSFGAPKAWNGSPQLGYSPTGVLQKSTFVTISNSSSGSSPTRGDNKKAPGTDALCGGIGSSLVSSTAISSL